MKSTLRSMLAAVALVSVCFAGCSNKPDPSAPAPVAAGGQAIGGASQAGVPKQGGADASMEAPVAAPSGVQTGNTAGGRR
jgi:hypothetical protein